MGPAGGQGPQGEQGPAGPAGPAGQPGALGLNWSFQTSQIPLGNTDPFQLLAISLPNLLVATDVELRFTGQVTLEAVAGPALAACAYWMTLDAGPQLDGSRGSIYTAGLAAEAHGVRLSFSSQCVVSVPPGIHTAIFWVQAGNATNLPVFEPDLSFTARAWS